MLSRCLLSILGLAVVWALPEEDKAGMVDDYEFNVATNCREYPAFGVTDPRTCSQMKQDGSLNYNPVVGNNRNAGNCDVGWAANQGKCYKLETTARELDIAAADCGSKGAQLLTIHNMETNLYIKNLLSSSAVNWIFLGAKSDAPSSMKWMVGSNVGDSRVTTDFSNLGQTFENALGGVTGGEGVVMTKGKDAWEIIDLTAVPTVAYVCEKNQVSSKVGFCRWDAFRANTDVKSACMCPTNMNTCSKRPNCFWYEDPNSPFKECISNSERFYNMLHRLLVRRGKKDFAIKIRYGSTPARGQMPFGPYGPAVIGAGNPNPTSMFGVYGHKNPYDSQRGMGMFGNQGHFGPQRQSQMNPWGQSLPGRSQFGYAGAPHGQPGGQQMWRQQPGQQMGGPGQQMGGQPGQQMGGQPGQQTGGQPGQQTWGQRQQVYHEGNRFNPHRQQNHKQY